MEMFADYNFNIARIKIICCRRGENIVGKDENDGYKHFGLAIFGEKLELLL